MLDFRLDDETKCCACSDWKDVGTCNGVESTAKSERSHILDWAVGINVFSETDMGIDRIGCSTIDESREVVMCVCHTGESNHRGKDLHI
jgi:hypothetical protein